MNFCEVRDSEAVRGPCGLPGRLRLPDGSTRTDLAALPAGELRALGWWPVVETRPALSGPTEGYGTPALAVDAAAGVVRAVYPAVALPDPMLSAELSKLRLRRALRARGLEPVLEALLESGGTAAADWADAVTLRMDDPLLAALLPVFRAQAGVTDDDVRALVEEARV